MYNPESVLENETHKVLRDLEIQTDLISTRRPELVIFNNNKKENRPNSGLCLLCGPQSKIKRR